VGQGAWQKRWWGGEAAEGVWDSAGAWETRRGDKAGELVLVISAISKADTKLNDSAVVVNNLVGTYQLPMPPIALPLRLLNKKNNMYAGYYSSGHCRADFWAELHLTHHKISFTTSIPWALYQIPRTPWRRHLHSGSIIQI